MSFLHNQPAKIAILCNQHTLFSSSQAKHIFICHGCFDFDNPAYVKS